MLTISRRAALLGLSGWAVSSLAACGGTPSRRQVRVGIAAGDEGTAVKGILAASAPNDYAITEMPYENLRQRLKNGLFQNLDEFDLIMIDDPWFPELAEKLSPIDDLIASTRSDFVPASLNLGMVPHGSGELRAVPYVGNCQLLFYRTDMLQRIGVPTPPQTWTALREVARRIRAEAGKAGYCVRAKSGAPIVSDFLPVLWSYGGDIFQDTGNPTANNVIVGSAATHAALAAYRDLVSLSPAGAQNFDWTEMTAAFSRGDAALELNWPAAIKNLDAEIARGEGRSRRWGVALPPAEARSTSMAGNWLLAIPQRSSNRNGARDAIRLLLERQREAVLLGNPPTRTSLFSGYNNRPDLFYLPVLSQALERSTPRPRTPKWSQLEDAVSVEVTRFLTDETTPLAAANRLQTEIARIMQP